MKATASIACKRTIKRDNIGIHWGSSNRVTEPCIRSTYGEKRIILYSVIRTARRFFGNSLLVLRNKYTALIKLDAIFFVIERVLQENIFKKLATLLSGEHKML